MGTRYWQGLLKWTQGSRDPQQGTTCLIVKILILRTSSLEEKSIDPNGGASIISSTCREDLSSVLSTLAVHLNWWKVTKSISITQRVQGVPKKCTRSRPFTFHAWAMFCKKTSVRCQWSCPITLQSLCQLSCIVENQISWVIALSRTSADSNRWAALALTTGAQILHDWLPFWWTWALSPTAHKLEPSLKTVPTVYWHEDIDFYCIWPIKCIIILPTIDWKILQMPICSNT